MSPVWMMKGGLAGIAGTLSTAARKAAGAAGLAGFSTPNGVSDIWTKEKLPSAALAEPIRREDGTPPATVQTTPVPAHSMHFRVCRRSRPPSRSSIIGLSWFGKGRPEERPFFRTGYGTLFKEETQRR